MQILLSYSQAWPGTKAKQGQEEISRNHVPTFFLSALYVCIYLDLFRHNLSFPTLLSVLNRAKTLRACVSTVVPRFNSSTPLSLYFSAAAKADDNRRPRASRRGRVGRWAVSRGRQPHPRVQRSRRYVRDGGREGGNGKANANASRRHWVVHLNLGHKLAS